MQEAMYVACTADEPTPTPDEWTSNLDYEWTSNLGPLVNEPVMVNELVI